MPNAYARLGDGEWLECLLGLLPRGIAWPRESDATLVRYWHGVADVQAAFHQRLADLSERESDPSQTVERLDEWEAAYGLPDPCVPQPQTIDQRRAALVQRIADQGGQSAARYIALAALLGYTITIQELHAAVIGRARIGDPIYGTPWNFVWVVHAPAVTVTPARVGHSACGEPIASWGNTALECVLRRLAPAHTVVMFAYAPLNNAVAAGVGVVTARATIRAAASAAIVGVGVVTKTG